MSTVRNVIFDLGGVLLDWNPGRVLASCYADPALCEQMRAGLFGHADWIAFDRGELTEPELLTRVQQRTGRDLAELARVIDTIRDSLVAKPDTVAVLRSLSARQVPLYCLSNMPMSVFTHVRERYDFWDAFSGIVVSGDVRMAKPERAVFEHILEQYRLVAEETVFVDDLATNIAAAEAVGLRTVLFRDAQQCSRDLEQWFGR
jgi:putative hydrolase of the HAD superfamily